MATQNIQLKDGQGNQLMPKTKAEIVIQKQSEYTYFGFVTKKCWLSNGLTTDNNYAYHPELFQVKKGDMITVTGFKTLTTASNLGYFCTIYNTSTPTNGTQYDCQTYLTPDGSVANKYYFIVPKTGWLGLNFCNSSGQSDCYASHQTYVDGGVGITVDNLISKNLIFNGTLPKYNVARVFISNSTGTPLWTSSSNSSHFAKVRGGATYRITTTFVCGAGWLTDALHVVGTSPNFTSFPNQRILFSVGTNIFVAPNDAEWLYFPTSTSQNPNNVTIEEYVDANILYSEKEIPLLMQKGMVDGSASDNVAYSLNTTNYISRELYIPSDYDELEIINTNVDENMAIYRRDLSTNVVDPVQGYVKGVQSMKLTDKNYSYIIRMQHSLTTGIKAIIRKTTTKVSISDINDAERGVTTPIIGYNRQYTPISSELNWENKMISGNTIVASNTHLLAVLPNWGSIEVKLNSAAGIFAVYKEANGTIEELTDGFIPYSVRYTGDHSSTYYVCVKLAPTESAITPTTPDAIKIAGVYKYVDEGKDFFVATNLKGKNIAFIGDSITQGRHPSNSATQNLCMAKPFSNIISEMVGCEVANYGIGGALVWGTDWKSLYENCGNVVGYDVVFVLGGTNDYGGNVSATDFVNALSYVVQTLKANNTEVVLASPIYRTSKTGANAAGLYLYDYSMYIRHVAWLYQCKYVELYYYTMDWERFQTYIPDGLHPTPMGHRVIANALVEQYDYQSI